MSENLISIPVFSGNLFHLSDVNEKPWSVQIRLGYPVYIVHQFSKSANQISSPEWSHVSRWESRDFAAEYLVVVSITCSTAFPSRNIKSMISSSPNIKIPSAGKVILNLLMMNHNIDNWDNVLKYHLEYFCLQIYIK